MLIYALVIPVGDDKVNPKSRPTFSFFLTQHTCATSRCSQQQQIFAFVGHINSLIFFPQNVFAPFKRNATQRAAVMEIDLNAFWRSTQCWGLHTEDSLNVRGRNLDSLKWTFYAKNLIGLRRLSRFIFGHFGPIYSQNVRRSWKLQESTKMFYRSRLKIIQGHWCWPHS